jgi:hypothetical protein
MWTLDLELKCTHKYICDHIYLSIFIVRKNKIVLVGLCEGTPGGGRGKENVRE